MLGQHLTMATDKVMWLARNVLEATIRSEPAMTSQQIIDQLILPQHQRALREARGIVQYYPAIDNVPTPYVGVQVQFNWSRLPYARAEEKIFNFAPGTPLSNLCERLSKVRQDWERVMAVLHYFDRYGTPGAARYYWPTIVTLAPDHDVSTAGLGNSFVDPINYSQWLPMMRDTATTVASALMLATPEQGDTTAIQIVLPTLSRNLHGERFEWGGVVVPLCD
jgi:hypothetical protein